MHVEILPVVLPNYANVTELSQIRLHVENNPTEQLGLIESHVYYNESWVTSVRPCNFKEYLI